MQTQAFQTTYIPEQHISIDEAMCLWRGRVYMKDKPIKRGIKFYELTESKSGYVWRFEVFCGMPGLNNRPYEVVQCLLQPLKSLGYCLYTGESLVSMPRNDQQSTGAAIPQDPEQLRFQGKHYLVPLKTRRYCHVCFEKLREQGTDAKYRKNYAPRTKYECNLCKKALCVHPCMQAYHTIKEYSQPLQN
ncbi:hypothetical protein C0Q70_20989 [Pomacea canaliculata]|uniref:PiggyBac transposable element-derived protein domain-containing protein n=1 Tax=Pomacea canaliculata TaxID=400727 RepID=A0A2T7NB88_POMCA|nr:hypothetical protein C0Q70_20989 [Pomacea canaliculata]